MTWNTNIDNRLVEVQGFPKDQTEKILEAELGKDMEL